MGTENKHFNCSQDHELDYVSGLYNKKQQVRDFLKENCKNGNISNSTHDEVYKLIKTKLGLNKKLTKPVKTRAEHLNTLIDSIKK